MGVGMQPELTICIPTLCQPEMLTWCLRTLTHHAPGDYKIVVVEQSPDPKVRDEVHSAWEKTEWEHKAILHMGENIGEMGAINMVLDACDTPYFAWVHDDVAFVPGSEHFWSKLIELVKDERVGAAVPSMSDCTGLQHFLRWDLPTICRIWTVYGACLVTRTEMFRSIGGMDGSIVPSCDIEISVRLNARGYAMVMDRSCYFQHARHQTYKYTRLGDDKPRLEKSFNKIIRKHGVAATCEMMFHETEWTIAQMVSPTWTDFQERIEGGGPQWLAETAR